MKEGHQPLYSDRQRTVVLTFDTPAEALAWDQLGDRQAMSALTIQALFGRVSVDRDEAS